MEALTADTEFLANHNVMDYSLLTAICPDSCEVVVGIIGMLRSLFIEAELNYRPILFRGRGSAGLFLNGSRVSNRSRVLNRSWS